MTTEKHENTNEHNFYELAIDYMIKHEELIPVEKFLENGGEINRGSHYLQLHSDKYSFLLQLVVVSEIDETKFKVKEVENTDGVKNTTSYYTATVRKYGKSRESEPTLFTYAPDKIDLFNRRAEQMKILHRLKHLTSLGLHGELSIDAIFYAFSSNIQALVKDDGLLKEKKSKGGILTWLFGN